MGFFCTKQDALRPKLAVCCPKMIDRPLWRLLETCERAVEKSRKIGNPDLIVLFSETALRTWSYTYSMKKEAVLRAAEFMQHSLPDSCDQSVGIAFSAMVGDGRNCANTGYFVTKTNLIETRKRTWTDFDANMVEAAGYNGKRVRKEWEADAEMRRQKGEAFPEITTPHGGKVRYLICADIGREEETRMEPDTVSIVSAYMLNTMYLNIVADRRRLVIVNDGSKRMPVGVYESVRPEVQPPKWSVTNLFSKLPLVNIY
ncbi:Uncharacterised protein [uncultured archaeon]|nr:Uncharacterised protein [uncultured archaeon]